MKIPHCEDRIERVTVATLEGIRPRSAGKNARLGVHGDRFPVPVACISAGGLDGWGWAGWRRITEQQAESLIGKRMCDLQDEQGRIRPEYYFAEFPIMDWLGRYANQSVHAMLNGEPENNPFSVPCYDTSIYFDDLHLQDDDAAVELICQEASEGYGKGHRAFKIKVGRGGMHMPLKEGLDRDVKIINGIRGTIGSECRLMIDANNAYNVNLTKELLTRTAQSKLYWIEEMFHEDDALYANLKMWIKENQMSVLIADGEGFASPALVAWAEKGLIDVVQYDFRDYGMFRWMELGERLDEQGIISAPHNYGGAYGNYTLGHMHGVIRNLAPVEWDEAVVEGMDDSAYTIKDGHIHAGEISGFGLEFDIGFISVKAEENGFTV